LLLIFIYYFIWSQSVRRTIQPIGLTRDAGEQ